MIRIGAFLVLKLYFLMENKTEIILMKQNLKNKQLLKKQAFINGVWVKADNSKTLKVLNPATDELIGTVPDMGKAETQRAIEAAHESFKTWKKTSAAERAMLLRKWWLLQNENIEDLATILSAEQGKPLAEAKGEIKYGASYIEWFAEETRRIYGDIIPGHESDKRIMVIKQPVGVVCIITPWNFPNAMIARKVSAALAAGCTVVIKPAEATPLSALAMVALIEKAGFPKGVVNIVTTARPALVGDEMCLNPLVRKVSFTGSTAVGKILIQKCANTVKRLSMELGGNAPFIVFDDASIDEAVKGAMISKFRNAGQTCVCANRIYVQASIYNQFIDKFKNAVSALNVGNGLEASSEIGPLIDIKALSKVNDLVADAKSKGATVTIGGELHDLGKTFYKPTILTDVNKTMRLAKEEIFGPVAPVFKFETEQEVIDLANDTEFGLAAYFYGSDISRIFRVAESLEYGMIGINTGLISTAVAPFGGVKESGFGREGSKYGLDDYTELKYLCLSGI
jgi:succinate-semialdehyde dehydrogenase / glutarate-semialdehyde dehydrogenase